MYIYTVSTNQLSVFTNESEFHVWMKQKCDRNELYAPTREIVMHCIVRIHASHLKSLPTVRLIFLKCVD